MDFTAKFRPLRWAFVLGVVALGLLGLVSVSEAAQNITLEWNTDSDPQVTGYRLYYGTASGVYTQAVDVGGLTSATIPLTAGTTYYAVVTGYNAAAVESLPSTELSFSVAPVSIPTVSLASPGSTINGPATLTLNASASDANASITRVEFYVPSWARPPPLRTMPCGATLNPAATAYRPSLTTATVRLRPRPRCR